MLYTAGSALPVRAILPTPISTARGLARSLASLLLLSRSQHWLQEDAAARGLLSCGKPCSRALPGCSHLCTATCHVGPCPGPCSQPVTVRCDCRRLRSKLPCHQVTQQLAAAGQQAPQDPSAAVRLLACDAECSRVKVAPSLLPLDWHQHQGDETGMSVRTCFSMQGRFTDSISCICVAYMLCAPIGKQAKGFIRQVTRDWRGSIASRAVCTNTASSCTESEPGPETSNAER